MLRTVVSGFALTLYVADPLPVPEAGDENDTQASFPIAAQVQPAGSVTTMLPLPPVDGIDRAAVEIDAVQVVEGAAWLTVTDLPATVSVALRAVDVVLAATV